ncbi:T9SS type A sorting domain-containing protein [Hymenobacter sp. 5317J-9]|uniref:T9SS type A sorting domain-containing protein n=1 Tax=Hymenobacter sp. 5317J-9 TaxID=2932250 RepID=UPI001FD6F183|nr:T9SS type A sorting domain-containing protein [Hymenobacter sp. 5317J-9]UOQ99292.1 T9SS type A sorting domain-containing protein [Hymenobacter sp. 5317J-9]
MRRLLPFLLLLTGPALAQTSPIIDRTDMPALTVGVDSLRLSVASPVLPATAPPLSRRGTNQTWNYAGLTPTSQRVETFLPASTVTATSAFYQLTFGPLFGGVNRATVASPQELPLAAGGLLPITDTYQFYNLTVATAAQQDFRSVGYGASLAGTAVPVTYVSQAQQDVIYRFPLSFASPADSSNSYFTTPAATATVGYLSQKRKRVNKPDAWGTLTTPFGTFQTVRVVTRLEDHDSVSVGGVSQGFDVPVTREYKWLAKTHHVPLLTITTRLLAGQETITSVEYRDIYRRIIRLAARDAATDAALNAFPNPSAVGTTLTLSLPAGSGPLTVSATDLVGRELFRRRFATTGEALTLDAEAFGHFRGMALLTVTTARGTATRRVVRE